MHRLCLFLLLLQTICQQQTLLDASLSSRRRIRDRLNKRIANIKGTLSLNLIVFSYMHNRLIQLLFYELIVR